MLTLLFLKFFNTRLIYKIRLSIKIQVFWSRDRKNLFLSNQELFLVGECQMSLDRDFLSLVFYKLLAKAFFKIVEHWSLQYRSFIMFMVTSQVHLGPGIEPSSFLRQLRTKQNRSDFRALTFKGKFVFSLWNRHKAISVNKMWQWFWQSFRTLIFST